MQKRKGKNTCLWRMARISGAGGKKLGRDQRNCRERVENAVFLRENFALVPQYDIR